jgi:Ca2+-binding EF-hand superfamily protein
VTRKSLRDFDEAEAKMKALMQDQQQLKDLWHRIDFNGNNIVSLAEIDKMVVEKFSVLNHKPALMRAYKATINSSESNGDDWVQKKEFKRLLGNLFYFNKIFWIFDNSDGDKDRRMDFAEFKNCLTSVAGGQMTESAMRADFSKVDRNGGGFILFDEFCRYFTQKACPKAMEDLVD